MGGWLSPGDESGLFALDGPGAGGAGDPVAEGGVRASEERGAKLPPEISGGSAMFKPKLTG